MKRTHNYSLSAGESTQIRTKGKPFTLRVWNGRIQLSTEPISALDESYFEFNADAFNSDRTILQDDGWLDIFVYCEVLSTFSVVF